MATDIKMGNNCNLKNTLSCAAAPPAAQCSVLQDLIGANPDADFTCVDGSSKKQTVQCVTPSGKTSTKRGKKKSLIKWAKSSSCSDSTEPVFKCRCANQISVFVSVTCVADNTYACVLDNGLMETFKVTKCKKLKKSKCARRN